MTRPDRGGRPWAVEVDAIEPSELRRLCREVIERHVDQDELAYLRRVENIERDLLASFTTAFAGVGAHDHGQIEALAGIANAGGTRALLMHLAST